MLRTRSEVKKSSSRVWRTCLDTFLPGRYCIILVSKDPCLYHNKSQHFESFYRVFWDTATELIITWCFLSSQISTFTRAHAERERRSVTSAVAGDLRVSGLLSGHRSQVQRTHRDNHTHLFTFSHILWQKLGKGELIFVALAFNIDWGKDVSTVIFQFDQQYFQSSSWPFLLHILGQIFSCLAFWLTTDATKLFVSLSLWVGKPMEPGKLAHLRWERNISD